MNIINLQKIFGTLCAPNSQHPLSLTSAYSPAGATQVIDKYMSVKRVKRWIDKTHVHVCDVHLTCVCLLTFSILCPSCTAETYSMLLFIGGIRVEAGIMRWMVLWDTACNFNAFISNQSIFNCLITGASTPYLLLYRFRGYNHMRHDRPH